MKAKAWDLESKQVHGALPEFNFTLTDEWINEEERREKKFTELDPFPDAITVKFKNLARSGIPMTLRRRAWLVASGGKQLLDQYGDVFEHAVHALEAEPASKAYTEEELFGGSLGLLQFLPDSLVPTIRQFLRIVWSNNHGIQYSPLMPTISIILLLFMEPPLAYLAIQAMINRSREDEWYFTVDKKSFHNTVVATEKITLKKVGDVCEHATQLGLNIAHIALTMMPAFFLPFMPIPVALTIFDSFIIEGRKILTRFIIMLFKQAREHLLAATTKTEFIAVIVNEMDRLSNVDELNSFLNKSFNIYLARKHHMFKLEKEADSDTEFMETLNHGSEVIASILNQLPPTAPNPLTFPRDGSCILSDLLQATTPEEICKRQNEIQEKFFKKTLPTVHGGTLFTNSMLYSLRNFLPSLYQRQYPQLIYALSKDGSSFRAFEAAAVAPVPHFLVIKTESSIIGAFLSDPPNPELRRQASERYFGGPTMFVFKAEEVAVCYKLSIPPNRSFISIDRGAIIIGGPKPAIIVHNSFSTCASADCETFGSPPLLKNPDGERIIDIELYQLSLSFSALTAAAP